MCPPGYYQFANDPTVTHALGHMTVHHIYIYIYQCWKQYTGSSKTKSRYRANHYKSTHRKFKNKKQVRKKASKQKLFHEQFCNFAQMTTMVFKIG